MRRWKRPIAATVLVAALLSAMAVLPQTLAAAPKPGSGGWYWPTGTENFGGFYYFNEFRGDNWHLAQDMRSVHGRPVYAIGDGVVLEANSSLGGYGPGNGRGGAMIILHETVSGAQFKALYGHVEKMRYRKGDRVKAGAVVANINAYSPAHLHFGIHPGRAYPPDGNPFRGHTYTRGVLYGFVDPVAYLRTHLRAYVAPPLPAVASVNTTSTPLWSRANSGTLYWATHSEDETRTWAYRISNRSLRQLDESATPPPADTRRYLVKTLSSPRPSLRVSDRRPKIPFTISPSSPTWGSTPKASGRVTNALNKPFGGARVIVERRAGTSWVALGRAYTNADGRWALRYKQTGTYGVRVRFAPPAPYVACSSAVTTITPKAALSRPAAAATSKPRSYALTGTMRPRHPSGAIVDVTCQRLVGGRWVTERTQRASVTAQSTANTWRTSFSLSRAGTYRVHAMHPADSRHVRTCSSWRTITVK